MERLRRLILRDPNVHRRMFAVIVTSSGEQREAWLGEVRELVQQVFPIEPIA